MDNDERLQIAEEAFSKFLIGFLPFRDRFPEMSDEEFKAEIANPIMVRCLLSWSEADREATDRDHP